MYRVTTAGALMSFWVLSKIRIWSSFNLEFQLEVSIPFHCSFAGEEKSSIWHTTNMVFCCTWHFFYMHLSCMHHELTGFYHDIKNLWPVHFIMCKQQFSNSRSIFELFIIKIIIIILWFNFLQHTSRHCRGSWCFSFWAFKFDDKLCSKNTGGCIILIHPSLSSLTLSQSKIFFISSVVHVIHFLTCHILYTTSIDPWLISKSWVNHHSINSIETWIGLALHVFHTV